MARAALRHEGLIVWSRRGWQGVPTWTLRRAKLKRQEVRNVYAIVTAQAIERGEPPPPLPANLYSPRSRKWNDAQAARDLAVFRAEHVRNRIDERVATGESEEQQAKRIADLERARAIAERLAKVRTAATPWTGPNVADLNERFGSRRDDSLGIPR